MKLSNSEISLYVDTLIVETLLTDSHLVKSAQAGGVVSDIISRVKGYVMNNIDTNDKAGSLINLLAPGALMVAFGSLGLPLGGLLALCLRIFHIDVAGILKSVWESLKGLISGNKQTTSQQVDSAVDTAIQAHSKEPTQEEADAAAKAETKIEKKNYSQLLRDAKLLKLAIVEFEKSDYTLIKKALPDFFKLFSGRKSSTTSILGSVLKWIFKIAIASAGFMVAGDVINKFLGRPNALDGTVQNGKPVEQAKAPSVPKIISKQTKFKLNPSYHEESLNTNDENPWIERIPNNKVSIASLILGWAKQVYQGLDGLDSVIQGTAGYQTIVETITWQNDSSTGGPIVFIPRIFTSKKMVVDHFIDEVAEKAT